MTPTETLEQIAAEPNATIRKFRLMKVFGDALRQAGVDAAPLSASQVEAEVRRLLAHV